MFSCVFEALNDNFAKRTMLDGVIVGRKIEDMYSSAILILVPSRYCKGVKSLGRIQDLLCSLSRC